MLVKVISKGRKGDIKGPHNICCIDSKKIKNIKIPGVAILKKKKFKLTKISYLVPTVCGLYYLPC